MDSAVNFKLAKTHHRSDCSPVTSAKTSIVWGSVHKFNRQCLGLPLCWLWALECCGPLGWKHSAESGPASSSQRHTRHTCPSSLLDVCIPLAAAGHLCLNKTEIVSMQDLMSSLCQWLPACNGIQSNRFLPAFPRNKLRPSKEEDIGITFLIISLK